ncbi:MAG: hypothetical protein A3F61_01580 [Candidatus Blackburnbacteria bacterium RIFCSPHIGHO2_12_FULL_41_13b]|uniref:Antitoxin Xre/MbcA/ParS-like toxin-binding domain-containing protein n=1 Tax=Candidatus Blackburnbacteria bacterium RIFCSPHIGHO2_12_FULL_41_13b TaxID=1797517 RepID=A0A1G1VC92_9BACT|nr:MAG: hypothetical protein A3F61_01580 [Candidatus Blackburnbacteria bacterium RIFCSPHIGHO2_12_FULL_41_13b]
MSSRSPEFTSPEQNEPVDSYWTTSRVASQFGLRPFEVRTWSKQMRLLEARTNGGLSVFPASQFVQRAGVWSVLPGLHEVLKPFKGVVGPDEGNSLASWLNTPEERLGGISIIDHLKQDRDTKKAVDLAQETANCWSK